MTSWVLLALVACNEPAPVAASVGPHDLSGRLVDHAGAPVPNTRVLACTSGYCQDAVTRSDGRFRFTVKRPVTLTLKAEGVVAGPGRRAAALLPGVAAGAAPVDVGDLHAPDLPPGVMLPSKDEPAAPLAVGDGLVLTIDRSALRAPVHTFLHEAAARRLPDERASAFEAIVDDPIVAVYAVEPFGTTSAAPIAVALPSTLPAGTAVHFRTLSAVDGTVSEPVAGRADGTMARTDPELGVRELSYVVVTRP